MLIFLPENDGQPISPEEVIERDLKAIAENVILAYHKTVTWDPDVKFINSL